MPRQTLEQTAIKVDEILDACEFIYRNHHFKDITIKEIAALAKTTRTSLYTYFQSKEEIFLALFEREYTRWSLDLQRICQYDALDVSQLSRELTLTLQKREILLKILSSNIYDMEENSRIEKLVSFKKAYGNSKNMMSCVLNRFMPQMNEQDIASFLLSFLPFMHGVYLYAYPTSKQRQAMDMADVAYEIHSIYDLSYSFLLKSLSI